MDLRCWKHVPLLVTVFFFINVLSTHGAPAYKIKHYNYFKPKQINPSRLERRLIGGSSPIHYISPFMAVPQALNTFGNFFVPPPVSINSQSRSNVFKLPLQLLANGKPHNVIHGLPRNKHQQMLDYIPRSRSKIINLPLTFLANGKPEFARVYMKDRYGNYI